jgi:quercetin dioxygenase-like cupin family protein
MRYRPGAGVPRVVTHDFVEEVLVLEGEMEWLADDGSLVQRIGRNGYVCRPPGVAHGPFRSEPGCVILEICYYEGS